jgi:hypothetical protein
LDRIHTTAFAAVLLATLSVYCVNVEWTAAYCSNPEDGPMSAVYGFPFPHAHWTMVSSFVYFFTPSLAALNLLFRCAVCFAALMLAREVGIWAADPVRARMLVLPVALLLAWSAHEYRIGWWIAAPPPDDALRPVAIVVGTFDYECRPSPWWFGEDGDGSTR